MTFDSLIPYFFRCLGHFRLLTLLSSIVYSIFEQNYFLLGCSLENEIAGLNSSLLTMVGFCFSESSSGTMWDLFRYVAPPRWSSLWFGSKNKWQLLSCIRSISAYLDHSFLSASSASQSAMPGVHIIPAKVMLSACGSNLPAAQSTARELSITWQIKSSDTVGHTEPFRAWPLFPFLRRPAPAAQMLSLLILRCCFQLGRYTLSPQSDMGSSTLPAIFHILQDLVESGGLPVF